MLRNNGNRACTPQNPQDSRNFPERAGRGGGSRSDTVTSPTQRDHLAKRNKNRENQQTPKKLKLVRKAAMETSRFTETNGGSEDRLEMFFWWVL